jgi:hypothetical protein
MTNGYLTVLARDKKWLSFANRNFTCGRIAYVSYRAFTRQSIKRRLIEHIRDKPHRAL